MLRLTDLSIAIPSSAWTDEDADIHQTISKKPEGAWRLIDYVCDGVTGKAIQTTSAESAEISIPISQQGWYAISIAMAGHYDQSVIELRLSEEDKWQTLRAGHGDIQEVPWRFSELKGQSIQIRYPRDLKQIVGRLRSQTLSTRVFWIRLEAMKDEHVAQLNQSKEKPLVYLNDGHSLFWWDDSASKEDVQQSIKRYADSEWQTCCFCNGGADLVNYPSKFGTRFGESGWDDPTANNHKTAQLIESLIEQGEDVLQLASDQAKAQQHDFWFYLRPQAWVGEPPFDHAFRSRFFSQHPEFRCLNQQGKPIGKLSYAFSEVRKQINGIIQEGLDRGANAVGIALVRSCPLVYFEQPVLDRYRERYGKESFPDDANDSRLIKIWTEFIIEWLREIRALLTDDQHLFLITVGREEWNQNFGVNLAEFCGEGLIDDVLTYPEGEDSIDLEAFKQWVHSGDGQDQAKVRIFPGLGNFRDHGISVANLQKRALSYYQQGANGLNRWDATGSLIGLNFNQPDYLQIWQDHYLGEQKVVLQEYAGLFLDEYPPLDGF